MDFKANYDGVRAELDGINSQINEMGELNQYMAAMVNDLPVAALGGAAMMEYVAYLQGLCKRIDGLLQHSKALTHAAERSITEIEATDQALMRRAPQLT